MDDIQIMIAEYAASRYIEKQARLSPNLLTLLGGLGGGAAGGLSGSIGKAHEAYKLLRGGGRVPKALKGWTEPMKALGVGAGEGKGLMAALRGKSLKDIGGAAKSLSGQAVKDFSLGRAATGAAAGGGLAAHLARKGTESAIKRYGVPAAAGLGGAVIGSSLSR